jgi:hypothetical protein
VISLTCEAALEGEIPVSDGQGFKKFIESLPNLNGESVFLCFNTVVYTNEIANVLTRI